MRSITEYEEMPVYLMVVQVYEKRIQERRKKKKKKLKKERVKEG